MIEMKNKRTDTRTIQKKIDDLAKVGLHVKVGNMIPNRKYIIIRNIKNWIYNSINIIRNIMFYFIVYILIHILIFGGNISVHLNNPIKVIENISILENSNYLAIVIISIWIINLLFIVYYFKLNKNIKRR